MKQTIALLTLLALVMGGVGPALATESGPAVEPAVVRTVPRELLVDAVVEAVNQSTVSAQTAGRVVEINFDVDDFVPKGSVLLRFHDTEQQAGLAQAQAGLREARVRLREAQDELERVRGVYAKKLVAKAELDRASANLDAARARLDAAEASARQAQEQLDRTVVRAPYAGIVVTRHVELGEMASPGQPLMTGFSLEQLRVTANVPEVQLAKVREFGRARVWVPGQEPVSPTKLTALPYADPQAHTFKVRLELPDGVTGLYPGMFVKVAFVVGDDRRLVVPASAVVYRSEVRGVYVVAPDGRISLRQVRIGHTLDDGSIEVLAGLDAGEQVARDPIQAGQVLKQRQVDDPDER